MKFNPGKRLPYPHCAIHPQKKGMVKCEQCDQIVCAGDIDPNAHETICKVCAQRNRSSRKVRFA